MHIINISNKPSNYGFGAQHEFNYYKQKNHMTIHFHTLASLEQFDS
jgi:GH35 family endo-1,4-beta-xylanase